MANNGTRYHAEIKVELDGHDARINVFGDHLAEIFQDLATVCQQFPVSGWKPPAGPPAGAPKWASTPPPDLRAGTQSGPDPEIPTCAHCGAWDNMELIHFTDKKTGQPRSAWKCQECDQWHFPDRKPKRR